MSSLGLVAGVLLLLRASAYPYNDLERGWASVIGVVVVAASGTLILFACFLRGWLRLPAGLLGLLPLVLGVMGLSLLLKN